MKTTPAAKIFGMAGAPGVETKTTQQTAWVDGRNVHFELQENVTQRPTSDKEARLKLSLINKNAPTSSAEIRWRSRMIQLSLIQVTVVYLVFFLVLNIAFAGIFYAHPDTCCDDPDLTFGEVFDFTVQTSTTIGYGGYVPHGIFANLMVVVLSYTSVLLNTVFAGLIFLKFITPTAKLEFSSVLCYCNVNGLPCLQLRVGNADGEDNILTDVTARLTHLYPILYRDDHGREREFVQKRELKLLNDTQNRIVGVWTIQHVIDETSPLYGLNLDEFPGNTIYKFEVTINAIQDITKSPLSAQSAYMIEDILIGHAFEDQIELERVDIGGRQVTIDYAKLSSTFPSPVWYPKPSRTYRVISIDLCMVLI